MTPEFRAYQRQVVANCRALAEALMGLGYRVVTGTAGSEPMRWPCSSSPLRPGVAVGHGLGTNCQHPLDHEKAREFQKNIYFCFIDYAKAFDCVAAAVKLLQSCPTLCPAPLPWPPSPRVQQWVLSLGTASLPALEGRALCVP